MKTVGRAFDGVEKVIRVICGVLAFGFTFTTLIAVIARYVFNAPIWWSEQFCRYLFIWMLMLYFPIIARHEQNLGFDMVVRHFPKKVQDIIWLICQILICAFGCFYCYYTIQLCQKFTAANKLMDGIRIPASIMYSSQAVGAFLLALFTLEVVINLLIKICHEDKEGSTK